MHRPTMRRNTTRLVYGLIFIIIAATSSYAQGFGLPSKQWGLGFGNTRRFTGIRFNFRDSRVQRVTGINVTLWQPYDDDQNARVNGISVGLIPGGGYLRGLQVGVLGVSAYKDVRGISFGVLGVGSGGDMWGINIGGLGAGAGGDVVGLNIGGLGIGSGRDLQGITIGGLGAGAGRNVAGINLAVLGIGAGENLMGLTIAGLGAGAGKSLKGITLVGLGAGAPEVAGFTFAGGAVGGVDIRGITLAGGVIRVVEDGGIRGFGASAFNYVQGTQKGLFIGIVNFARRLKGIQLGVINIAMNNPKGLRVLPLMNAHF